MSVDRILISIKPKFVSDIMSGAKDIELRRVKPRFAPGSILYIYSTTPVRSIIGIVEVKNIYYYSTSYLRRKFNGRTCTTHTEFFSYFEGQSHGCGIELANALEFAEELNLTEIRKNIPHFAPPQSYQYIRPESRLYSILSSHA